MGYTRSALLLEWPEDSEFSGLEVRMKRLSIRQLVEIQSLEDLRKSDNKDSVAEVFADLLDAIAGGLLGWNYEAEDGAPIPATREALDDLDVDLVLTLVKAWTRAAAAVPLASSPSSPAGEPAPPDDEWASYLASSQVANLPTSPVPV